MILKKCFTPTHDLTLQAIKDNPGLTAQDIIKITGKGRSYTDKYWQKIRYTHWLREVTV